MISILYIGNRLSGHGNTPTAIEVLGPLLEKENILVRYASSRKNKLFRLCEMLWNAFISRNSVNYVLIDTYSTYNFWYAFAVSQLCRIFHLKYIPILHGGNLPKRLERNPKVSDMIFRNSLVNVAPSGFLHEKFSYAGYKNLKYIPNPVELHTFQFHQRDIIGPKLLWVRSLAEIYNPMLLLRVAAILLPEFPNLEILMVGPDKGEMLPKLQKEAERLGVNVNFTGIMSKSEWAKNSTGYDIFVNTSHVDNAPYSLIEAASLGLPIVSTEVGGIPYLFEHGKNALLVADDDAMAMAGAIKTLISNKLLASQLVENALFLSRQFSWDIVRSKWLEILK
ncbi:MAG TPA: glycosyltransferase family 4 protein [Flavobacterium sp.]